VEEEVRSSVVRSPLGQCTAPSLAARRRDVARVRRRSRSQPQASAGAKNLLYSRVPENQAVTGLLIEVSRGNASPETLLPLVYDELRRLAEHRLKQESPGYAHQATSLVHEVYLKLVDQTRVDWKNKAHFFAVAAQAMRRILIDYARRSARPKHGGPQRKLSLDEALTVAADQPSTDLVALDRALNRLATLDPEAAHVVELRFFGGLTNEESAEVLGTSPRTVRRRWQYAKAWLYRELTTE
jgi:RNA polymerase sigma-70 factor (ECF subfamily)